jgi:hypothetical protein
MLWVSAKRERENKKEKRNLYTNNLKNWEFFKAADT